MLYLCDKRISNTYMKDTLKLLSLMLRSPDTETTHNTIVTLDTIVNGTSNENSDPFMESALETNRDEKIEFLIEQAPCDYFIKQLT